MLSHVKAFIITGGDDGSKRLSSVLTLPRGASSWTPLASLPRALAAPRASIEDGKMRLTGGLSASSRSEVSIWKSIEFPVCLKWGGLASRMVRHLVLFACHCQVLEYQPEPSIEFPVCLKWGGPLPGAGISTRAFKSMDLYRATRNKKKPSWSPFCQSGMYVVLSENSYFIGIAGALVGITIRACWREVKIPNQYGGVILLCLFIMYKIDPWL